MFVQRALTFFILGPAVIWAIYTGGAWYAVPLTAVIALATYEYTHIVNKLGLKVPFWLLLLAVLSQLVSSQFPALSDLEAPFLVVGLLTSLIYALWAYEYEKSQTTIQDWFGLFVGVLLLGWVGGHLLSLRVDFDWQWAMLAMLSAWIADSGAYVVGKFLTNRILGRHALSPRLSPNKTVEGFVAGVIIGTAVCLIFANANQLPLGAALAIGLLSSIISPVGDLAVSLLKRESGVKDSGVLFPGHGGALDRIDTLIWSGAMTYYVAVFMS